MRRAAPRRSRDVPSLMRDEWAYSHLRERYDSSRCALTSDERAQLNLLYLSPLPLYWTETRTIARSIADDDDVSRRSTPVSDGSPLAQSHTSPRVDAAKYSGRNILRYWRSVRINRNTWFRNCDRETWLWKTTRYVNNVRVFEETKRGELGESAELSRLTKVFLSLLFYRDPSFHLFFFSLSNIANK